DTPAAPETLELCPVNARRPSRRPEREIAPTPALRRGQLNLTRDERIAGSGAVAAVLQLEPARADASGIPREAAEERIRERAHGAGSAHRSRVLCRREACIALVGRRGRRGECARRAQNGEQDERRA